MAPIPFRMTACTGKTTVSTQSYANHVNPKQAGYANHHQPCQPKVTPRVNPGYAS